MDPVNADPIVADPIAWCPVCGAATLVAPHEMDEEANGAFVWPCPHCHHTVGYSWTDNPTPAPTLTARPTVEDKAEVARTAQERLNLLLTA